MIVKEYRSLMGYLISICYRPYNSVKNRIDETPKNKTLNMMINSDKFT